MTDQSKYAEAFNLWMDDYVNNPDKFESAASSALNHLREQLSGQEPTYGEVTAATFSVYLGLVQ